MSKPFSIVILGGGTAGWMAANLMAKRWQSRNAEITVIESPQIGIVGVGEGSTPQLKAFFDQMGVAESQWILECNATYKTGIRFKAWSAVPGFEEYSHPFPALTDRDTAPAFVYNCILPRDNADVNVSPDTHFLPACLAAQKLGPIAADNFPFPVTYDYHLDAHLVGKFIDRLAEGFGVKQVQEETVDVKRYYIVCHYKVNARNDSEFWVANRENLNLSDSLQSLLEVWQSGQDLAIERQGIADYYSTLSWHCLLEEYGIFPHDQPLKGDDPRADRFDIDGVRDFNRRCALNFAPHTAQLLALQSNCSRSSMRP